MGIYKKLKNKPVLFFSVVLVFMMLCYGYIKVFSYGSYSRHQWRQADCLSIVNNYFDKDLPLHQPEIMWVGPEGHGKTVSEFPVFYYLTAQIWKVIGKQEWVLRFINFLIICISLVLSFKMLVRYTGLGLWSGVILISLFTSPILVFYTPNYLSNAPAFGFVLIAWYFIHRFAETNNTNNIYWASVFFLLAGLLKVTALISFAALIILWFIDLTGLVNLFNRKVRFKQIIVPVMIVFVGIGSWYLYAKNYNHQNISGIFLQKLFPIWDLSPYEIKEVWRSLYHELLPRYMHPSLLNSIFLMFFILLIDYKRVNKVLLSLSIVVFLGVISYILLWFKAFDVHDYYLINLLIIVPVVMVTFLIYLKDNYTSILNSSKVKMIVVLVLFLAVYKTMIVNRAKHNTADPLVKYSITFDKKTQDYWNWYHWNYSNHFKALESIEPYLREIGIQKSDRVVSIPDQSINITLYLMNQPGFTEFGYNNLSGKARIDYFIQLDARYLVVNDTSICNQQYLIPYLQNQIGAYENVKIYDLLHVNIY